VKNLKAGWTLVPPPPQHPTSMTADQIAQANAELRDQSPQEIVRWAIAQAGSRAIVSTNFRPYEAVLLHLVTQVQPQIPVFWVDHGYNKAATYKHAQEVTQLLHLNLQSFVPRMTAAHYDALHGGAPEPLPENEERIKAFSTVMKLEPFQRGMKKLAPTVWITALRKVQNPNRAGLGVISEDANFGSLKVSPVFHWTDKDMHAYLTQHDLPIEWDYFDPAKADEKRECGLHAVWGGAALAPV
jgi:phosphoadenosine phosphosulfate reductase